MLTRGASVLLLVGMLTGCSGDLWGCGDFTPTSDTIAVGESAEVEVVIAEGY